MRIALRSESSFTKTSGLISGFRDAQEGRMEQARYLYILVLALFVIAGRKFLDAWRDESPRGFTRRLIFGGLCLACFLIVAFFEVRL